MCLNSCRERGTIDAATVTLAPPLDRRNRSCGVRAAYLQAIIAHADATTRIANHILGKTFPTDTERQRAEGTRVILHAAKRDFLAGSA